MQRRLLPAFAAACLMFCTQVPASPISWQFTGLIDQGNNTGFFFPFAVGPGDQITIDLSLEPGTPCSLCSPTRNDYQDPLTGLSFTAKGTTFNFPLDSSNLLLVKDATLTSGEFLNLFGLTFTGFNSSPATRYVGDLILQGAAAMPPVPGINDAHLANLQLPDPAAFVSPFPGVETNFFSVGATQDGGFNEFGGRTLSSSVNPVPEFDQAPAAIALTLLFGALAILRARRRRPL